MSKAKGKTQNNSGSSACPKAAIEKLDQTFEETKAEKLAERPPNSFTRAEYIETTGIAKSTAANRLNLLLKSGKIKPIRFPVRKSDSVIQLTQGYQIVDPKSV